MRYEELRPPAPLADFVECLWLAADGAPGAPIRPEAVAPDGCVEWIFHRASPYRRFEPDGGSALQPSSLLVGVTAGPVWLAPSGRIETLGVRFRPGGVSAFLPLPADALEDRTVATDDVWGPAGRRLAERVLDADEPTAHRLLEEFLLSRLDEGSRANPIRPLVARLLRRGGNVSVDELASLAGWTPRHLEREFRRRVGLSPKRLGRIARFQNLVRLSGRFPERRWSELAAAAGYSDQAHMIRDHREFAGAPPSRRAEVAGDLSRRFVEPDRLDELLRGASENDVGFLQDAAARPL